MLAKAVSKQKKSRDTSRGSSQLASLYKQKNSSISINHILKDHHLSTEGSADQDVKVERKITFYEKEAPPSESVEQMQGSSATAATPFLSNLSDVKKSLESSETHNERLPADKKVEAEQEPETEAEAPPALGPAVTTEPLGGGKGGSSSKAPAPEAVEGEPKSGEKEPAEAGGEPTGPSEISVPAPPSEEGGEASPASPEEDPAFQSVITRAKGVAKQESVHEPAKVKASQAHAAAKGPPNEVESQAKQAQVEKMDAQEPKPFSKEAFKAALLAEINRITPKNLEEADDFKKNNKAGELKQAVTTSVNQEKENAQGAIKAATEQEPDKSVAHPKEHVALPPAEPGPAPPDIGAEAAAPKPKSESEISLEAGSQSLEQQMVESDIDEQQLQNSNEPEFQSALVAKKDAQIHAKEAPVAYRQEEQAILEGAQVQASETSVSDLESMHAARTDQFNKVAGKQNETTSKEEQKRAEIAAHVEGIYTNTKQQVEARLAKLDSDVTQIFDSGSEQAKQLFENHVSARMQAFKEERYSGGLGWYYWGKDKLLGMPSEVNEFYVEGRELYISKMDEVIDTVASTVEAGLNETKSIIAAGRQEVKKYVESLPTELQSLGNEAAANIESKFEELDQQLEAKNSELVEKLGQKYVENLKQVDDRITQMKEENKGLVNKAMDAIGGVIKTIIQLKNMLLGVLAKVAAVVGKIIKDPIGFLGNLIKGVKTGLQNFIAKIGEYLKKGLMDWLFGALSSAGIQMPDSLDFKGILSIVLQVLGLTYNAIRRLAVKKFGEPVVKGLEQASEIFKIMLTEGVGGLWKFILEKLGDLKDMVIEGIKNFLMQKVIIAGITWIIGLLNPASAFIKAAKAIYDIVMFIVTRGSQIMSFVNAVLDSVAAIAGGNITSAAAAVENALAKGVPVVIGFLAGILGLSGISEAIKGIITKVQSRVHKGVDWVLDKAAAGVRAAGKFIKGLFKGKKEEKVEEKTEDPRAASIKAIALADIHSRIQKGKPSNVNELHSILSSAHNEHKEKGLKSVSVKVVGEEPKIMISASASAPEDVTLDWKDAFKEEDLDSDTIKLLGEKLTVAGQKTTAALSFEGRLIGQSDSSKKGHAEDVLLSQKWDVVLKMAEAQLQKEGITKGGKREQPLEVILAINRTPCTKCSRMLQQKSPATVKEDVRKNVKFILAASGVYEPTQKISPSGIIDSAMKLIKGWNAALHGRPPPSLEEAKSIQMKGVEGLKVEYREDITKASDLSTLQSLGWELRVLSEGGEISERGEILAEFIVNNKKKDLVEIQKIVTKNFGS